MYKVLVSNDDGIQSPGLRALVAALSDYAEVYVVAPRHQQSAKARALTFRSPVAVEAQEVAGAVAAYALDGTPADCVMWGIGKYKKAFDFDFVFSGINHGRNTGLMAWYSGTVAAALEGAVNGVRSIAMSVKDHGAEHFEYICSLIPELMEMSRMLPAETILNVNAPNIPAEEVRGIRFVDIAPQYNNEKFYFEKQEDGSYRMQMVMPEFDEEDLTTDFGIVAAGYASISPIRATLHDAEALERLKEHYEK